MQAYPPNAGCENWGFRPSYVRAEAYSAHSPMMALQDACLNRMTPPSNATDAAVVKAFTGIPALLDQIPGLIGRGRFLDCECLIGPMHHPFHVSIRAGRIVDLTPAPVLMRSWRFSYRASAMAWTEYWQPTPKPGWHDLLALTKRGEAVLEGDLHPFMSHLQYFKDVLTLPRQKFAAVAS
jgi:hypothetical protein